MMRTLKLCPVLVLLVALNLANAATDLPAATRAGDLDGVRSALADGADLNASDERGRTPLHWAAMTDQPAVLSELVSRGAAVHAADNDGNTPLHLAARQLRRDALRQLLAAGADVNARNAAGQTPLHVLGRGTRPDIDERELADLRVAVAQALLDAGADPALLDDAGAAAWPQPELGAPQVLQPSGYPTYDDIAATLLTYQNTYPTLCQRYDVGPSSTTKRMYALRISDNVLAEEDEPEFRWISSLHGDEVTGVVLCLNMINYLLTNYGTDPRVTNIVDEMEIWVMPCANPYGYINNTRYNATGSDLNRSFPEGAPPSPQPNTTSGKPTEVATIMNWAFDRSFTLSANYHGGALVFNYPFDNDGTGSLQTPDNDLWVYIAEQYTVHNSPMWNGDWYHGITLGGDWYEITGGLQDWSYRYMGCNDGTIEVSNTKSPAYSQMPTFWNENRESMLAYMETCLIGARGVITDGDTGLPVDATVVVVGRDHNIYTDPDVGDYHRMLLPGTYTLQCTATGYETVVVPDILVTSGDATRVDLQMGPPVVLGYPDGGEELPAGVPATITWSGNSATPFQVQYSDNYGAVGQTTDGFESGSLGPEYATGGSAPWYVTTSSAHSGVRSCRAGTITHSQTTWLTRTVGNGTVSFWYRVSSESGYDWFNFYVDGVQSLHRSGNVGWTLYTTTLTGSPHTLKWEYVKDAGVSGGSDTAWIDDLTVTADATEWTDIGGLTPPGATSAEWTPAAAGTDYKVRVRTCYGGNAYGAWDESAATFTVTEAPPTGACCYADGSCSVTEQAACTGTWQGADTVCDPNPCPQPQGACCYTDGSCSVTQQAACTGTWQGADTVCDPNPCPQPWCMGDMNCSGGAPTFDDIKYFAVAMSGEAAWQQYYRDQNGGVDPPCPWLLGDYTTPHDGVEFSDIKPFAAGIGGACQTFVP